MKNNIKHLYFYSTTFCLSKDEPFLCMHFTLLQPNSKERIQSLFIPGLLPDKQIAQIPEYDFINDIFKLAENYKSHANL